MCTKVVRAKVKFDTTEILLYPCFTFGKTFILPERELGLQITIRSHSDNSRSLATLVFWMSYKFISEAKRQGKFH